MDILQKGVLTLVKSAVTGQPGVLPEGFRLEDAEPLIQVHQIAGIAYEGAVLCGISKQDPMMQKLFQRYYQQILLNEKQMSRLDRLYAAFEENGIDYMPVKGCELKKLYPNPAIRTMGDADILIRMEQYDIIRPLMAGLGYRELEQADHELPWVDDTFEIELHRRLMPTYDPDYYSYIGDGWQRAHLAEGHRYAQSREDMYIFLFIHFTKHYRSGGVGIRQLVDLWLYGQTGSPLDQEYIENELKKVRLDVFYGHIQNLIRFWFEDAPTDERMEFMSQFLFASGSFGEGKTRKQFEQYRDAKNAGSVKSGKLKTLIQMLFPNRKFLQKRYPILKKAPWLTPVFWPVRWVTAVLFRRDNIEKCQQRLDNFTTDNIETFDDSLKYVGLDFPS